MLILLHAKNDLKSVKDLGYPQQYKIMKYLESIKKFKVIDSADLLKNPQKYYQIGVNHLGINFEESMFKMGKRESSKDGIWWHHWYDNVIKTTHFQKFSKSQK